MLLVVRKGLKDDILVVESIGTQESEKEKKEKILAWFGALNSSKRNAAI